MMVLLVIVWGLELAIAKDALEYVDRLLVLNVKYFFGFFVIAVVAKKTTGFHLPALRDLPLILCGHYETERIVLKSLMDRLQIIAPDVQYTITLREKAPLLFS